MPKIKTHKATAKRFKYSGGKKLRRTRGGGRAGKGYMRRRSKRSKRAAATMSEVTDPAIIKRVRELSGGQMEWTDGMLYPVLHRLARQGLIGAYERLSEQGRKRRYYRLRRKGITALSEQKAQWLLVYDTLRRLWEDKPCLT